MRYRFIALIACAIAGSVVAAEIDGTYRAREQPSLELSVAEGANGAVTGALREEGNTVPVAARRTPGGFEGRASGAGNEVPISAVVRDASTLLVTLGDFELTFARLGAEGAAPPGVVTTPAARAVVINGKTLEAAELERIEQRYGVRIDAAEYWYDAALGAWGLNGGPALGFIMPGMELGGPLAADASGGGTPVVVNGRALHPVDLLRLQSITGPIQPGRYFLLANGLAGVEGGPPLWNLFQMAANPSNSWQSRLSSGFSDGTTGAVFLPNGGFVSTGQ